MHVIVIANKTDLPQKIDMDQVQAIAKNHQIVTTSLLEEEGIADLEQAIATMFFQGEIESSDMTYVSNSRHIALLHQALQAIEEVLSGIEVGTPIDIIQIDLTRTWELLGEIIGDTVQESLIDQLFSQFCLGK